jgi:peptidoglycan hydrolase-like protein with peptidoglycan-binding domain
MNSPFTRYTSDTLDEFETNGPFSSEQHDHESYGGSYESHDAETALSDDFSFEGDASDVHETLLHEPEFAFDTPPSVLSEAEIAEEIEHQVKVAQASKQKKPVGRTNWAKGVLNRILGLNLADDNNLDADTKKAIESFQSKNNLTPGRTIDPVTERALLEADALLRAKGTALESATINVIREAKTKIEDWTKKAVNNKPKHILNDYRDPRKVFALVLHHMAFKRRSRKTKKYSDPESYLATGAHFCILFDGRIIQLHTFTRMIWHSNCTSGGSVGVEFEGNFPNINGKWWVAKDAKVPDQDRPTQAQFESGRFLASYLKSVLGITRVLAHRQSSKDRENDPGPDVWYNVGQWAIDKLGLSDGGPTSQCGDGKPILPEWRTWGSKTKTAPVPEVNEEADDHECYECQQEMDDRETEYNWESNEAYDTEPETETDYESDSHGYTSYESDSSPYPSYESEDLVRDWSEAVKSNRYYGEKLGWNQYIDRINDMLLPYSGMSNVSLGEEAFAEAVFQWQSKNGFTGTNIDGIIGPGTWSVIRQKLNIGSPAPKTTTTTSADVRIIDGVRFKKKNNGWAAYGGGPLRERLYDLRDNKKKLSITPTEIEMFRLVSIPESGGLVNAINSWDNMYMSMGFIQFTFRYYELIEVIKAAPAAFKKYGIELDPSRKYFPREKESVALKNVPNIEDLRSLDWAVRFYRAGLEDDVIIAQITVGRRILNKIRSRADKNGYLNRFNDQHPNLWAFIYEAHNSRPAPFNTALQSAIIQATSFFVTDAAKFAKILIEQLKKSTRNYYSGPMVKYKSEAEKQKRIADELAKVGRIIEKTGVVH